MFGFTKNEWARLSAKENSAYEQEAARTRAAKRGVQTNTISKELKMSDLNAKYKAEFKSDARYAKNMSESDFVAMRRVDEGLDFLPFATLPDPPVTPIELNPLASGL